jgi:hypothetical protein
MTGIGIYTYGRNEFLVIKPEKDRPDHIGGNALLMARKFPINQKLTRFSNPLWRTPIGGYITWFDEPRKIDE